MFSVNIENGNAQGSMLELRQLKQEFKSHLSMQTMILHCAHDKEAAAERRTLTPSPPPSAGTKARS